MASTGEEPTGCTVVESSPSVAMEAKLMLASSGHVEYQKLKDLLNKKNATPMVAVIEFSRGKEPSSSSEGAKAPAVAMDARLMVSTAHGECQKLKNLLNKKDATITMVVTASCNQASEAKPSLTSLQLQFLAAAWKGDSEGLKSLINSNCASGTRPTGDIEEGNNVAASSAASSLLKVVTEEGDTALHLVATNGEDGDSIIFRRCAELILEEDKDKSLLYKKNKKCDTPLHCAVRAGKSQLVSHLIRLAEEDGKVQDLLRTKNSNNETALHEAVRRGENQMVKELLRADPELASFPTDGTSPLYLAIQLIDDRDILRKEDEQASKNGNDGLLEENEDKSMAQTLYDESKDGFLSYLGPNGQNALHAAVLRGPVLTKKLLRWNKDLTIQRDKNGSTPLHFAAGLERQHRRGSVCSVLLEADTDAFYHLDNDGLSPIHVAASVDKIEAVGLFLKRCPGSAGLRDAKGRTFLHVAVENKKVWTVYACMNSWPARIMCMQECMNRSQQAWTLNLQDNDGNTALHLAVTAGSLQLFSALFANREVDLNRTNAKGQTPLDIAFNNVPPGIIYEQNSEVWIRKALQVADARHGVSRWDHFRKNYQDIHGLKSEYEREELGNMKDLTQTGSITSVLIATVAFGATFALPGGYRADDHTNGGTPTLAGRYAFDAFMMANTLAFILSAATVVCLGRSGSPMIDRSSRIKYLVVAFSSMEMSVVCLITAFALGVFVVLSPVARKTAVAICVLSPLVVLCSDAEYWLKMLILVRSFWVRKGPLWTAYTCTRSVALSTLLVFWPLILIFIWPVIGRIHPISKVEQPARPPSI